MSANGLVAWLPALLEVRLSRASAMHWSKLRRRESLASFLSESWRWPASALNRLPIWRPVTASNSPRRCTIPSSPSHTRTQRRARCRACSLSPPSPSRSTVQRRASLVNCSGRIDSALASRSRSASTSAALVFPAASASRLAFATGTRPDSTASRSLGASRKTSAVLTWLRASCRDRPAPEASTSAPPSPCRSRPATSAAADTWAADMMAIVVLNTASIWRSSEQDAEPSWTSASTSLAAASARRAASINMKTVSHRGTTSVKHLRVF